MKYGLAIFYENGVVEMSYQDVLSVAAFDKEHLQRLVLRKNAI